MAATEQRRNLASLVGDFERNSKQIAIVVPWGLRQRRTSYGELALLARGFAGELESRGIRKGDRVLLWGENGAEWIAAFFGCILRGVLPVPIDFGSSPDFARRVAQEVSPKLITGTRDRLHSFATESPSLLFEEFEQTLRREPADSIEDLSETMRCRSSLHPAQRVNRKASFIPTGTYSRVSIRSSERCRNTSNTNGSFTPSAFCTHFH